MKNSILRRILLSAAACASLALVSGDLSVPVSAAPGFGISKVAVQTTIARETPAETKGEVFNDVYEPYEFTQADGHPFALTTTIEFNNEKLEDGHYAVGGDPRDVVTVLPPGLLGNPMAVPRCPLSTFTRSGNNCPTATQVGIIEIAFASAVLDEPIYNLVPEFGQSAEFGVPVGGSFNILLTAHLVHTSTGYGFTIVSNSIPQRGYSRFKVTFWGVPADPSHDPQRGRRCETPDVEVSPITCPDNLLDNPGGEKAGIEPVPFLIMPDDCTHGPERFEVSTDSWQEPGHYVQAPEAQLPAVTGCTALSFPLTLGVSPDTTLVDSPVGLGVDLHVPQPEEPEALATPNLRNAVVTLPNGVSVNPGIVDGIQACNEFGPEGLNETGPESEQLGPDGEEQLAPGHCPDASIVGTAEAVTPLLPEPVKGHLFLARPLCGEGQPPCTETDAHDGRLYRLYLELGGTGQLAQAGVNIKAQGVVSVNLATGQITSTFTSNPQAPFSDLRLHLNGGPRASLANPQTCGEARTSSDFTPWSAPGLTPEGQLVGGTPDANPSSYYIVAGCAEPTPLNPGLSAGTLSADSATFSPFVLNLTRHDGEQDFADVQVRTPPGLLGMLSDVPLCEEPAAAAGTCPQSSRIGSTLVASGAGSHPFEIAGSVYLTKSYKGSPFGLSIVTHAIAGPFDLGLIVVRARIDVDPTTSALTVTSGPLPQIVFGVPLRLQRITVSIDRSKFMFNPTSCSAKTINATVSGSQGAATNVSSPFAAGKCARLTFKPDFKVSTNAHTSRAKGASIDAKLSYPAGSFGRQANIARVKVSLPRQLPSRLSTLQKACPARVFDVNPVACPAASVVGVARSRTPVLPVTLSGPVYFVSHGGEEFPNLVVVLQGDGVRVDLTGATFISKANITSTTFKTVPDVPVNSFELYLPQGRFSALAATAKLCSVRSKLVMPTTFVAQNGAQLKQNTKIAVNGCATGKSKGARSSASKRAKAAKARPVGRVNGRS